MNSFTPPKYLARQQHTALQIARWRLEEIRKVSEEFLNKTYDEGITDTERANLAMFSLGGITAVLTMPDDMVVKRIAGVADE